MSGSLLQMIAVSCVMTLLHSYICILHYGIESGPVSELDLNSTGDTTLLISWGEPVSPNGNILSYSITITDLRDDSTVRSENRGAEESTSFIVMNLGA